MNARSIVNKTEQLEAVLLSHNPHIVVITETWLHSEICDQDLVPPAYEMFRRDRSTRGGGVAVLVKTGIKASRLPDVNDTESICLRLSIFDKSFVLYAVYRPPNSPPEYLYNLKAHMEAYINQTLIVIGDFNLPNIDWNQMQSTSDSLNANILFDMMLAHNLVQVVQQPTRVGSTSCSLLDLVFAPRSVLDSCASVEPGLSDHDMVTASFNLYCKRSNTLHVSKQVKNFSRADDTSIQDYLEIQLANFDGDDVVFLWDEFKKLCFYCLDKFVPSKTKKTPKFTPWITRPIIHMKRKARRLQKKGAAPHLLREVRKSLSEAIKSAKMFYFNTTLSNFIKEDPQKFWNFIRDRKGTVKRILLNGTLIDDPLAIAQNFNEYFHSVFSTSALPDVTSVEVLNPDPNLISFNGVLNLLLRLKVKSSPGPEGIPNAFLRRYAEILANYLVVIFRASIKSATLPFDWKLARVLPFVKKGDPQCMPNYRPISMTSACCKMLEHIIAVHITSFLDDHHILSPFQHGFRKGFSTVTQLVSVVHHIASVLDKAGQVDILFLDFSKAFDRVPHDKLINKLQALGIPNYLVSWISAYLIGRKQYVEVSGSTSHHLPVNSGVPQGSVLGPLLFLIYCNDIVDVITDPVKIRLFADDCILFTDVQASDDQLALNTGLNNILSWCNKWGMVLNFDKSVFLRITNKKNPLQFSYSANSQPLKEVSQYKYLGLTITNNLSWNAHIADVSSSSLRKLCLLRHKLRDAPSHVKLLAYNTLIRPKLEYACIVWDPHTKSNIYSLEKIQRRAVRFIYSKYGRSVSVTKVMQDNQIPTLQSRRQLHRLKFLYSLVNFKLALDPSVYATPLSTRKTRHSHDLSLTPYFARTNLFKFSFFPRTITEWNNLPVHYLQTLDSHEENV